MSPSVAGVSVDIAACASVHTAVCLCVSLYVRVPVLQRWRIQKF